MSTYLEMWVQIKNLDLEECQRWIANLGPATGNRVYFRGVWCLDVDLLDGLRNYSVDLEAKKMFKEMGVEEPPAVPEEARVEEPEEDTPEIEYSWAPSIDEGDQYPIQTALFQALGAASMCWENVDKAGVFLSEQAAAIGDGLYSWISEYIREGRRLDKEQKANLGLATNAELIRELDARFGFGHHHPLYKTVGGEEFDQGEWKGIIE